MEEKRIRKYFRVLIRRVPPYYPVNVDYHFEEDVWAFSEDGAVNKIEKQYKNCYGKHIPEKVTEIEKSNFRGDKVKKDLD